MTGEQVMYLILGLALALVVIIVVSRRNGGRFSIRWGDKSIAASGPGPSGRIEIAKQADVKAKKVEATAVEAADSEAARISGGGVSVGERLTVRDADEVVLTGVKQKQHE